MTKVTGEIQKLEEKQGQNPVEVSEGIRHYSLTDF
jgi:hypothetical protein